MNHTNDTEIEITSKSTQKILDVIKEIEELVDVTSYNVKYHIRNMRVQGVIKGEDPNKGVYCIIIDKSIDKK